MKRLIVFLIGIAAAATIVFVALRMYTKSFSPAEAIAYEDGDIRLSVSYSRPYKKGRVIFGELVPFGRTWRTGANEPTTFQTSTSLNIIGHKLPAGRYALFTVPGEKTWQIIFNKEVPFWGIQLLDQQAARNPQADELVVEATPIQVKDTYEQFTISFEEMAGEIELILMWDQTMVVVPMVPIP